VVDGRELTIGQLVGNTNHSTVVVQSNHSNILPTMILEGLTAHAMWVKMKDPIGDD
jgi:hypothetical protein